MRPQVLVVAGTDSSGGAGLAADLAALRAHDVGARLAVTAVTAQDAHGVRGTWPVAADALSAQLAAAAPVHAVKVGMLGTATAVGIVHRWLRDFDGPVVVDPVLSASTGGSLLGAQGLPALLALLRDATLVTPNLPELAALGGEAWLAEHPGAVLIKGGHGDGPTLVDRLVGAGPPVQWSHPRQGGQHRGTGCRLASAIAGQLALGLGLGDAVGRSIRWLQQDLDATSALVGNPQPE